MDFLDPNKKRAHRIKLYIGYGLVAILIGVATMVLLFVASGYSLDGKGEVVQSGLVFFNSKPGDAQVNVEGIYNKYKEQGKTDVRMSLREGQYKVSITKDGYRPWERNFSIEGGAVERMVYPFLFPNKLVTSTVKTYIKEPQLITQSPSRQWILVQQPESFTTFDVYDANNPSQAPTTLKLPSTLLSAAKKSNQLKVVEWSNDNNNVLVKHIYDGKTEFALINREKPTESININTSINQTPYEVTLKDKKTDILLLHMAKDGLLQEVNMKSKALTPLVGRAYAYKSHGDDMLVYVTESANKKTKKATVHIVNNGKDFVLRELPVSPLYIVDVASFNGKWYVVAGATTENQVYVYKDPLVFLDSEKTNTPLFARTLRIKGPTNVSFSANARMISVQGGQEFAVYDAETDRQYRYDVPEPIDTKRPAEWMDGHRLLTSTNKTTYVFDFDGINYQKLMPIDPSTDAMFDRDYETAYTLAPAEGKFAITRTKMLVE